MNKFKSISTIIPCYNQGQYLQRAIDSILQQEYQNFEIIVINDGSNDKKTTEIIEELKAGKYPYLRIFTIKNRGLAGARNYGLEKAQGNYIQFLDADDELLSDKWRKQIDFFEHHPNISINYTNFLFQKNNKLSKPFSESMRIENPKSDFLFRWEKDLSIPSHCFLFRKECFQKLNFNTNFKACEDWVLWSEFALTGCQFSHLAIDGCIYNLHGANMTGKKDLMFYNNILATSYLRTQIKDLELRNKFDQQSIERLKFIFFQYYCNELLKDNPDKKELTKIKSSKFFKTWQGYNLILRKMGIKHYVCD